MINHPAEIDLILLRPSVRKSSKIFCDSYAVTSETQPEFAIISYVVLETSRLKEIHLDGKDIAVYEDLETALCTLRHADDDKLFWIDPISIEKLEPQKPQQVMKELAPVHRLAESVFIWLGDEDRSRAKAQLSAVWTLINLVKQDAPEALDGLFSMPTFVNCLGLTQPLFRQPWWHWQRIEAMIDKTITSKVVFLWGTERMDWNTFASFVYALKFALPRVTVDYWLALDQILLQIPGKIPECFRETFFLDFQKNLPPIATDRDVLWGYGTMFAHPQDVLYWIQNTSPEHAMMRLFTRLSTRLCNRYRNRCLRKLRYDLSSYDPLRLKKNSLGSDKSEHNSDVALKFWLSLLISDAIRTGALDTLAVLRTASSFMEPSISRADLAGFQSPGMNLNYNYEPLSSATRQTRVLILYPSHNRKAELHCDLFTLDLDHYEKQGLESYPYLALSYVWGETVPQKNDTSRRKEKTRQPKSFSGFVGASRPKLASATMG